jgi:opacity protein-like surface antigen
LALGSDSLEVVIDESRLEKYVLQEYDRSVMGRDLNADYLWIINCDRQVPYFNIRFEIYPVLDPNVKKFSIERSIDHLDRLNERICDLVNGVLTSWQPITWPQKQLDTLKTINYPPETAGFRIRGSTVGFLSNSKNVYLGNNYRYGIEVSAVMYAMPCQFELSAMFDLGKTQNEYSAHGRYISLNGRWNYWDLPGQFRDVRLYAGAGISLLNFERANKDATFGIIVGGFQLFGGVEILLWRKMYLDLNLLSFIHSFAKVDGYDGDNNLKRDRLTSLSIGMGLGYRF